jgi:hypothetical protein
MNITIRNIELLDWERICTGSGYPVRYNSNYFYFGDILPMGSIKLNDSKIVLEKVYIDDSDYKMGWRPYFYGDLIFLEQIYLNTYHTPYIKEHDELVAKNQVDNFLTNNKDIK